MKKYGKIIVFKLFGYLGRKYIQKNKPIIIGITGSVGKTSCRTIVFQILNQFLKEKRIYTSPKNYNSELGIVFSIFKFEKFNYKYNSLFKVYLLFLKELLFGKKEYDVIILEYGIDAPKDMDFLLSIAKPDLSIFTKLDYIHLENFNTKSEILNEKLKLINNTKKFAFLNYEDKDLKESLDKINIKYNFYNKTGLIKYKYIVEDRKIYSLIKVGNNIFKTNILGIDNFGYLALGIDILKLFGINYIPYKSYIPIKIQAGRFTLFNGIKKSVIIDSTYNAGPESMFQMIQNAKFLRDSIFKDYKLLFVIGDMRELGNISKREHRKLFIYLKTYGEIISVGPITRDTFGNHLINFKYSRDAGKFLFDFLLKSNDKYLILFKGSQNTIFMEEALKEVLLDRNNVKKLVRQDLFWHNIKKKY